MPAQLVTPLTPSAILLTPAVLIQLFRVVVVVVIADGLLVIAVLQTRKIGAFSERG